MDAEPTRVEKFLSSRILNDGCKCTTWRNANYCFAVTVAIVSLNIILYAVCGSDTGDFSVRPDWGSFSVNNLFQALVNSYTHSNWQHTLLNMLCFLFAGIYLERKKGSLPFLLFMALMSLFTKFAVYEVFNMYKRYIIRGNWFFRHQLRSVRLHRHRIYFHPVTAAQARFNQCRCGCGDAGVDLFCHVL